MMTASGPSVAFEGEGGDWRLTCYSSTWWRFLACVGHDFLEVVELLELLLHAVEHLVLYLLRGRARPDHDRGHRGHREVRVFELAELTKAPIAREAVERIDALFAIERRLRRIGEGDVTTALRLRRGDYFQDITESFNAATAELRRQAGQDLADVDDLLSALDRSPNAGPLRDGLRATLAEMRDRKRQLLRIADDHSRSRLRLVEPGAR